MSTQPTSSNTKKAASALPMTKKEMNRFEQILTRASLALLRPDFVTDRQRMLDAAQLSDLASRINDTRTPCPEQNA